MDNLEFEAVQTACEREAARLDYPADFPALPPLPVGRYTDREFYELELKHVWRKTWLLAAHVSDLPDPGSFRLFEQLDESIIISRGLDSKIRAFHNICAHRGSPLLLEGSGKVRRFVCPYHSWGYNLEGQLVTVTQERNFSCLDRGSVGLIPVRCEVWRGHIFINLDRSAQPLTEFLGTLPRHCVDFPFEDMIIKRYARVEIDANWKAVYDNFIEAYHLSTVHPAIMRWLEPESFTASLLRNGHSHFRTKRRNGNRIVTDTAPLPSGSIGMFQEYAINLPIFPNVAGALDAGGFVWQRFWPAGPRKTVIEIPLYGACNDGVVDPVYWDNLMAENLRLMNEDLRVLTGLDRALNTGHLKATHMSCHEKGIYWYHEEIDRLIGPERITPELRVTPVLADLVEE